MQGAGTVGLLAWRSRGKLTIGRLYPMKYSTPKRITSDLLPQEMRRKRAALQLMFSGRKGPVRVPFPLPGGGVRVTHSFLQGDLPKVLNLGSPILFVVHAVGFSLNSHSG